jgi:hypothetical protein
MSVGWCGL